MLEQLEGVELTGWEIGGTYALTLWFEDGSILTVDPNSTRNVTITVYDDAEEFETKTSEEKQPQEPTAEERYSHLAESIHNVYTHDVTIDRVTGSLLCVGCNRENAQLGEEACDEARDS